MLIFGITYLLAKLLKFSYEDAAPSAMICLRTQGWFPGGEAVPGSQAKIENAPPDAMVP